MNANLSDQSRQILSRAAEESRALHHEYLGTEHLLLALLSDAETVQILAHFGLAPDQIRSHLTSLIHPGPASTPDLPNPPLTPRAWQAIDITAAEADFANQRQIDPPHLLLGLYHEPEGVAGVALRTLNPVLTIEALREQVFRIRLAQLRLIERTVRPVRAATPRKLKMREELLAHLEFIYTEEFARLQNPDAAFKAAAARFGDPSELTRELQSTIPMHERLSWWMEKHFGWRAPEHASSYLRRFSLQFLGIFGTLLAIFAAIIIFFFDEPIPSALPALFAAALALVTTDIAIYLLGNLYFLTRDALFGVFGSPKSWARVALLSAATFFTTLLIGLAFSTASIGSLHFPPSNLAGIAAAAIVAPILSLLAALLRGRVEIQQTHWECLNLAAH
jgi:hypothetical protein